MSTPGQAVLGVGLHHRPHHGTVDARAAARPSTRETRGDGAGVCVAAGGAARVLDPAPADRAGAHRSRRRELGGPPDRHARNRAARRRVPVWLRPLPRLERLERRSRDHVQLVRPRPATRSPRTRTDPSPASSPGSSASTPSTSARAPSRGSRAVRAGRTTSRRGATRERTSRSERARRSRSPLGTGGRPGTSARSIWSFPGRSRCASAQGANDYSDL